MNSGALSSLKDGIDALKEAQVYIEQSIKKDPSLEVQFLLIKAQLDAMQRQLGVHAGQMHASLHTNMNPLFNFQFNSSATPISRLWK